MQIQSKRNVKPEKQNIFQYKVPDHDRYRRIQMPFMKAPAFYPAEM